MIIDDIDFDDEHELEFKKPSGYDFSAPEDLLIEVIKIGGSDEVSWANHQIESYLVSTSPDGILGIVSYEAERGNIETFVEHMVDCPGEGIFVIEDVCEHGTEIYYSEVRPATDREKKLVP